MEKLTIQHIAPYLPYGLKWITAAPAFRVSNIEFTDFGFQMPKKTHSMSHTYWQDIGFKTLIRDFKPALYPISCLTKTIQHGNESFVPLVKLFELCIESIYGHIPKYTIKMIDNEDDTFGMVSVFNESRNRCGFTLNIERSLYDEKTCWFEYNLTIDGGKMKINQYQLFQKLAEWHINFVGIPEHLYINKETIKTKL